MALDSDIKGLDVTTPDTSTVRRALRIIKREDWKARTPKFPGYTPIFNQAEAVLIRYYTGVEKCYTDDDCCSAVYQMQQTHRQKHNMVDIGYNFLIAWNGTVFEGRGWKVLPDNPDHELEKLKLLKLPLRRVLIFGFIGNFEQRETTPDMKNSLEDLLAFGVEQKFLKEKYRRLETFRRLDYI